MSTLVRDPWSDARRAATQEVLDPDVAAVRRKRWRRQALGLTLGLLAFLAARFPVCSSSSRRSSPAR